MNILVFDYGGGTLDIFVIELENNYYNVKTINGDGELGGNDIDNALIEVCIEDCRKQINFDIRQNKRKLADLRNSCEFEKKVLSGNKEGDIVVDLPNEEVKEYRRTISRDEFETLMKDQFEKAKLHFSSTRRCKSKEGRNRQNNNDRGIIKNPKFQSMVSEFFNGKKLFNEINELEAVGIGASLLARMRTRVK